VVIRWSRSSTPALAVAPRRLSRSNRVAVLRRAKARQRCCEIRRNVRQWRLGIQERPL
jgi:hypothetical protein